MVKLIMPLAGNGQRFFDVGFKVPKPLIDIKGVPMFKRVIDNLKMDVDLTCIIREDHIKEYEIDKRIREYYPDCNLVVTPTLTEGAACTVRLACNIFNSDPMLIANSDQLMVWDHEGFEDLIKSNKFPGGIIPTFLPDTSEPKHSYVKIDQQTDEVLDLKEKEMISPIATVGVYYFGDESRWCSAHENQMRVMDRTNGEYYLAPTYNYIEEKVGIYRINKMLGMGTPEELNAVQNSEWWDRLDEIS